jgi:hypothetical protein
MELFIAASAQTLETMSALYIGSIFGKCQEKLEKNRIVTIGVGPAALVLRRGS